MILTKNTKNSILYTMLTVLYCVALLTAFYAVPVLMLVMWNREKPNSHEVDAAEPRAAKQQSGSL